MSADIQELESLKKKIAELARMTGVGWSVTGTKDHLQAIESFIKEKQGPPQNIFRSTRLYDDYNGSRPVMLTDRSTT